MKPLRVFVGVDSRQPVAYNVLQSSLHRHAKGRVLVEPIKLSTLPITRRGLTDFTYARFMVPWLCGYEGHAVFMDADVVVIADIGELFDCADGSAVQVMQEQARYEWSSVMLFDNAKCKILTPDYVDDQANKLLDLTWGEVGKLPPEWNHCVGYAESQFKPAKLYHFTQGIPLWPEVQGLPEDEYWTEAYDAMLRTVPWVELMGGSVHAQPVIKRMLRRYGIEVQ